MAVHAFNTTLTASTVSTTTLTSWQPFVVVTVAASPAGTVWVTTDGSTPTVGGADCEPVVSGTTAVLKNLGPRPEFSTTIPAATDPSATTTFTPSQTKVALISSVAAVVTCELTYNPGAATVQA